MNKHVKSIISLVLTIGLILPIGQNVKAVEVKQMNSYDVLAANSIDMKTPTKVEDSQKKSQIDCRFPEKEPTSRKLAVSRRVFKGYAKRGTVVIENHGIKSAEIYINGNKIDASNALKNCDGKITIDIGKYTVDGNNALKVLNIVPYDELSLKNINTTSKDAYINVKVLYPELIMGKPEQAGLSSEKLKKVDDLINNEVKAGFPGASLIIIKNGMIVKNTAYGYAKKYDGDKLLSQFQPVKNDTLFDLASNSKMFATNLAMQKLVSEGKINIDELVCTYIPEFTGDGREKIKVRDVITHSAGFAAEIRFFKRAEVGEALYSQERNKTLKLLEKAPLAYPTGTKNIYSDTDYMLLGYLIERVTGKTEDEYLKENVYKPLGLTHTTYNPLKNGFKKEDCAATERMGNTRDGVESFDNVRTYTLQGEVHDEKAFYSMEGIAGHAGLFSNTQDMAVLAQMLLNGGGYGGYKLCSLDTLQQFIKPTDKDMTYGLGWDRYANGIKNWEFGPYAGASTVGHTGWTGTVTSIDFDNDMAIILLTNKKHSPVIQNEKKTKSNTFEGDNFETGKYGSVMSLIYEALYEK